MTEKKYKGRKAYLNDFKKNETGNYEYQGSLYYWTGNEAKLRRELLFLWIVYAAVLALLITAGSMDVPGAMNSFYVVLPFSVSFVFGISTGWGLWRLVTGGNPLRAYVYEASVEKLPVRIIGTMVCTGIAAAGEIIYILRNGIGAHGFKTAAFLVVEGAVIGFSLLFLKRIQQMSWEKQTQN